MEARVAWRLSVCTMLLVLAVSESVSAATYRTPNFVVTAPTDEFAKRVGDEAERFRKELAVMWAGKELPRWSAPCPIRVKVGQIGAGGATTFSFHNGEVFGWNMNIQGTEERILDSVLPHEITHTILACRFRQPLPRWADEGISTLVEHESERRRQTRLLGDVMRQGNKIPLQSLLAMKEYPPDMRDVMKLYAQGYSLTDYLVQQGGRDVFLQFLTDALRHGGWDQALSAHYGVNSVNKLESKWQQWVVAGSPSLKLPEGQQLAVNEKWKQGLADEAVVRGQSPDAHSAPDPVNGQESMGSAPRFSNETAARAETPNAPAHTSAAPYQAARSRQELVKPVYSRPSENQGHYIAQKARGELQLTKDEFASPATPLKERDTVHPFQGSADENDPFLP
ncbi:MAG: hypothetical protein CMJ47_03920 [Planctomyces sp.]|uniref:Peptidase MA-like domain-containing protein n=1 Tax=Rubinisphaera brasiliensis (strain ATCC 49424 / DSM 5305 / JCM 21570 / IAM 15109 / NBRC 103401 / IFAM 1448) TaxID=756272 RepID=F0SNH7_RUBBR|nr:peptidase MA family metallohydrolase [Rubinisphaera brasiliensis]ADY57811.1 hypothetical protein Plabr_0181 [Rubinisphaera brasiliensis DSM 5305]MBB01772.1 hypothetical protein [Planctomyces sp.]